LSLWHGVVLAEPKGLFKAYVNPEIRGPEQAASRAGTAFRRLGLEDAWSFVEQRLSPEIRLPFFSVDLVRRPDARVKLYLSAGNQQLVERLVRGTTLDPTATIRWMDELTKGLPSDSERPPLVCLSFRPGGAVPDATVHVPIRCYVNNDQEALARTLPRLPPANRAQLEQAMAALAQRPLSQSRGILTYVSMRALDGNLRLTTYLAPGAYTPHPPLAIEKPETSRHGKM
jgi:hypothetical protein